MKNLAFAFSMLGILFSQAQNGYWQQKVHYSMQINMDVKTHQFTGNQHLIYYNNSPDTLRQVFYHLYFNAFQPGTMMAERTAALPDPDKRMAGRFDDLKPNEIGYQKINIIRHNSQQVNFDIIGTVMEVTLHEPILPGAVDTFQMEFQAQVPVQIRRSGRDNSEGIDYTMTQWYPKMAAYDKDGWHPDQYVGREFYGDFGDFYVNITIDKDYVIGATGEEMMMVPIEEGKKKKKSKTRSRNFVARNVHDFAWAADPNFTHDSFQIENGPTINLYYNKKTANVKNWKNCHDDIRTYFTFMEKYFGKYAYPQFSLIQAGDGGMEYPMCTMMLGSGKDYNGFFGLFVHEATHNWYYGMIGTNEQKYPWMDEGFTSFAEAEVLDYVLKRNSPNPHFESVTKYQAYVLAGGKATMATPADHFMRNMDYSLNTYYKGELFLMQLKYIIGEDPFNRTMLRYYDVWKFKHPKPEDFLKIAEDESGMQLDWFLTYWTQLNRYCDYAIVDVTQSTPNGTIVNLRNNRTRPMPVDVEVTLKDGMKRVFTIPLVSMYGFKTNEAFEAMPAWPWTRTNYEMFIPLDLKDIDTIVLDPFQESGDAFPSNNRWVSESN